MAEYRLYGDSYFFLLVPPLDQGSKVSDLSPMDRKRMCLGATIHRFILVCGSKTGFLEQGTMIYNSIFDPIPYIQPYFTRLGLVYTFNYDSVNGNTTLMWGANGVLDPGTEIHNIRKNLDEMKKNIETRWPGEIPKMLVENLLNDYKNINKYPLFVAKDQVVDPSEWVKEKYGLTRVATSGGIFKIDMPSPPVSALEVALTSMHSITRKLPDFELYYKACLNILSFLSDVENFRYTTTPKQSRKIQCDVDDSTWKDKREIILQAGNYLKVRFDSILYFSGDDFDDAYITLHIVNPW
jgi:hypothetical protein